MWVGSQWSHEAGKVCVMKNTTLAAMWIMDCQATRGEAKKNKVLYYCRLQYDDGGSVGDGNSNVCLCRNIFSL